MGKIWIIVAISLSMLLSGCAVVKSNVAVFHVLPNPTPPMTYAFLPLEGQESSLEYEAYKGMISEQLIKYQYAEVPIDKAEVLIAFNYEIDSGKEQLSSVPQHGQTGVSSSHTQGTISTYGDYGTYSGTTTYSPSYGVTGYKTVSRTAYRREVWLHILDNNALKAGEIKKLYEASVESTGSSSQIAKVMPALIAAIFKEFPGKSGDTRRAYGTINRF